MKFCRFTRTLRRNFCEKYVNIQNKQNGERGGNMFIHKIVEEVSLKLIELKDAERVFENGVLGN